MNRRLKTFFAAAALAVVASTPAAHTTGAQTAQEPERPGKKMSKPVTTSCPVHPEIKARSAGKCPKCRMEERKRRSAQEKKARAQEGASVNEQ